MAKKEKERFEEITLTVSTDREVFPVECPYCEGEVGMVRGKTGQASKKKLCVHCRRKFTLVLDWAGGPQKTSGGKGK